MPRAGLEPAHSERVMALNHVCMSIPPPGPYFSAFLSSEPLVSESVFLGSVFILHYGVEYILLLR